MLKGQAIVKIDSQVLAEEIKKQGVKIWWLAEQIHVDRKTVSRWVNGKVKWMREENLIATAEILNCPPRRLMQESQDEAAQFATPDEQTTAARLVHSEKLLAALAPSGKFDLAESLIRSLLKPHLPLNLLGTLYLELATCCWQQNKLTEAERYALMALSASERADAPLLGLRAQHILVIIYSKGGRLNKANEQIEICLSHPLIATDPVIHARVLFDQSNTLAHSGALITVVRDLRLEALALFKASGTLTGIQESALWLGMAMFLIEAGEWDSGKEAWAKGMACSEAIAYQRGVAFGRLIEAVILSLDGLHSAAMGLFETFYPTLEHGDTGMYEAMGASIYRHAGQYEKALKLAQVGIRSFNPVFAAHNHVELAKIHLDLLSLDEAEASIQISLELYNHAGAYGRMKRVREGIARACPACPAPSLARLA